LILVVGTDHFSLETRRRQSLKKKKKKTKKQNKKKIREEEVDDWRRCVWYQSINVPFVEFCFVITKQNPSFVKILFAKEGNGKRSF